MGENGLGGKPINDVTRYRVHEFRGSKESQRGYLSRLQIGICLFKQCRFHRHRQSPLRLLHPDKYFLLTSNKTYGRIAYLVLLVLRDEVVHVGLRLGELHLVHTLTSVPVEESFSPEHSSELLGDPLKELLDGGGVTDES